MKVIKEDRDMMKSVVIMDRGCGHKEYYGCITMRDGINYCRQCIYEIWQKEQNYLGWKPDPNKDFVFPYYENGENYYEQKN